MSKIIIVGFGLSKNVRQAQEADASGCAVLWPAAGFVDTKIRS